MKKEKAMPKENIAIKLKRDVANCEVDLKTANEVFNPYWSIKRRTAQCELVPQPSRVASTPSPSTSCVLVPLPVFWAGTTFTRER